MQGLNKTVKLFPVWTGPHEEIDYSAKLKFSDDEADEEGDEDKKESKNDSRYVNRLVDYVICCL